MSLCTSSVIMNHYNADASKFHYLFQDCINSQGETCGPGQTVSNGEEPQVRKPRRFEYSHQQKEEKEESRKFMIKATHNMCDIISLAKRGMPAKNSSCEGAYQILWTNLKKLLKLNIHKNFECIFQFSLPLC